MINKSKMWNISNNFRDDYENYLRISFNPNNIMMIATSKLPMILLIDINLEYFLFSQIYKCIK